MVRTSPGRKAVADSWKRAPSHVSASANTTSNLLPTTCFSHSSNYPPTSYSGIPPFRGTPFLLGEILRWFILSSAHLRIVLFPVSPSALRLEIPVEPGEVCWTWYCSGASECSVRTSGLGPLDLSEGAQRRRCNLTLPETSSPGLFPFVRVCPYLPPAPCGRLLPSSSAPLSSRACRQSISRALRQCNHRDTRLCN